VPGGHSPNDPALSRRRRQRIGNAILTPARTLTRDADSCTVTYRRTDETVAVLVGYGDSLAARIADADSQLPAGVWTRVTVSTPASIYTDVVGRDLRMYAQSGVYPKYEGKTVTRLGP
jgi:hypothetical protein